MIKVMFLPKVKDSGIVNALPPKNFYVRTDNCEKAETAARAKFSGQADYENYGMAVCIFIEVIYL